MKEAMRFFQYNGPEMTLWIAAKTQRLDAFLAQEKVFLSRMKASEAVRKGLVAVNGRIAKKGALVLAPGDTVVVSPSGEPMTEERLVPADLKLPILYEDDACMVVEKPAGISVHPAPGVPKEAPTILHGAAFLSKKRKIPFSQSSVLVHRLDKETTGCLLLAKTPAAHIFLQEQFADRTIGKQYLAIVAGVPSPPAAVIDAPIGRHSGDRTKMAVFHAVSRTRDARTTYKTIGIAKDRDAALLELDLHTGRTHQVRVHLKTIEHPVLGDEDYETKRSREITEKYEIAKLCLHAWKLRFVSPVDQKTHSCASVIPEEMQEAISRLAIPTP